LGADVHIKRIYEEPEASDGYRVLVDRLWPRGISRERAHLDQWARELAPSDELRHWFDHAPARFDEFRSRYLGELEDQPEEIAELRQRANSGTLTLLFAARNTEQNNAVVLAELVREVPSAK
jgi:uncharacterized protein YeaO (DUF488 family)